MDKDQREIRHKLRILEHADKIGSVAFTCRIFGIGRSSFYRWRDAYRRNVVEGLVNARPIARNHPNRTPDEVIRLTVMLYVRYPLSLRQVEDILFERGIDICHETGPLWWNRSGPMFTAEIRKRRVQRHSYSWWHWNLDEVFVRINARRTISGELLITRVRCSRFLPRNDEIARLH